LTHIWREFHCAHFAAPIWSNFLVKRMWNNASNLASCSTAEILHSQTVIWFGARWAGWDGKCRILALTNVLADTHARAKVIWYGSASQKWLRRWRFHQIRAADIKERCVCVCVCEGPLCAERGPPARSESTFCQCGALTLAHSHTETIAGCSTAAAVLKRRLSFPLVFFCPYRARCSAVAELVKTAYHVFSLTLQIHTPGRRMYIGAPYSAQKLTSCSRQHKWYNAQDRTQKIVPRTYFKWSGKVICSIQV
jgi:hypothetical protein